MAVTNTVCVQPPYKVDLEHPDSTILVQVVPCAALCLYHCSLDRGQPADLRLPSHRMASK